MSASRKVVLFVVEGPSEETAFALLFERIFRQKRVRFDVTHGDLTTKYTSQRKNARDILRDNVINYINKQPYGWQDLACIVQICDTDGAFIDDALVIPSDDGELHYGLDKIEAPDVDLIVRRNHMKQDSLKLLSAIRSIKYKRAAVPYSVYFLSRNMEHALHGIVEDLSDDEKERKAREFQRRYKDDIAGFVDFLKSNGLAAPGDYRQSWKDIQRGTRSLERGSNLHLALPDDCD